MKPNGNTLTLTVGRRENTHFQKPLSNGTPVPKLLYKHIWLITHRSHGTLAFTDASDLPKPFEQIPMWTPLLKTTPARISCAVCFNSDWNSGFTSQVWTEGLHIKNCAGKRMHLYEVRYEVYTRSVYTVCPGARHELLQRDCSTWAGTCCENNEQLKHENISATDSFSQRNSG